MIRKLIPIVLALLGLGAGIGAGMVLRPPAEAMADGAEAAAGHGTAENTADHGAAPENAAGEPSDPAASDPAAGDPPGPPEHPTAAAANPAQETAAISEEGEPLFDYVKLNNQFVVPVVENGKVSALVVMSLSLEVTVGRSDQVFALEPKLRDAFLQVLFDHANSGGFGADFTDTNSIVVLRDALRETAAKILGGMVTDVLITDLIRQNA